MTHKEYEHRKRALEEQLQSAMRIVQESYRVQLRALELVRWSESLAPEGPPPTESLAVAQVARPAAAPALLLPGPMPEPEPEERSAPGGLSDLILQARDELPDEFTRDDVLRVLGFSPPRSSLYRVLGELVREGHLKIQQDGWGRAPTVYRKVRPAAAPASEADPR